MSFVQRIKDMLQKEPQTSDEPQEQLELEPEEAVEFVEKTSSDKLQQINEREEKLISEVETALESLQDNLSEVEQYEDVDGIKAAEDIAESFYNTRKIMIENFEPENNSESYQKHLKQFLSDFNDVDRKEKALMDRMKTDVVGIAQNVQKLDEKLSDLDHFNNNALNYRKDFDKLRTLESEIKDKKERKREIAEKREKTQERLEENSRNLEDVKKQLDDLKSDEEWQKKKELDEELEELRNDRKQIKKNLSNAVSGLDRGLKKLIYQIENQGLDFDGDKARLQNLREKNYSEIEKMQRDLELAEKKIEEENLLENRQLEDFRDKVGQTNFGKATEKLQQKQDRIQQLESQIQSLEILQNKSSLEDQQKELENTRSDLEEELEDLQARKEELEHSIKDLKKRLEQQTEKLLQQQVKIQ